MYDERIEKLIELALADGELTEKEKQILYKKAEDAGIDLDEFEMVLDAKLFEKQADMKKADAAAAATSAPKSDKFGDVKKCPGCGAIAQSFQTKCPDCGHEFSNIGANVSIGKLFEMLNACEAERKEASTNILSVYGSLMNQALGGDKITEKKKSIISGFPIPNTKDDILEFLSLAIPNAKQKGNFMTKNQPENKSHNDLAPTWKSKCEQIIMKAKFSMKEDKRTLEEIMAYANELGIK
jgi:DnaJ-domain-containing protein 1